MSRKATVIILAIRAVFETQLGPADPPREGPAASPV
jgi:hypothetical protein